MTQVHLRKISIALHMLVGFGALAGGFAAVSNPIAPLGITTDMLKLGPFKDFFIPGLFLMMVLGAGNLFAGFLAHKGIKGWVYASGAMGDILVLWIIIQCLILSTVAALHVIFFIIGVIQGLIALLQWLKRDQIQTN